MFHFPKYKDFFFSGWIFLFFEPWLKSALGSCIMYYWLWIEWKMLIYVKKVDNYDHKKKLLKWCQIIPQRLWLNNKGTVKQKFLENSERYYGQNKERLQKRLVIDTWHYLKEEKTKKESIPEIEIKIFLRKITKK